MEAVCTDVNNAILLVQKINFEETFPFCKKKNKCSTEFMRDIQQK